MEDGITTINIIAVWRYGSNGTSILVQPARQTLPNGKRIPSGQRIWIPTKHMHGLDPLLKKIGVDNEFLNKLKFD